VQGLLERVGRGERVEHYRTERLRKDGTTINVSLSISPIKNASGEVFGASTIARDVTEQLRLEEQLRQTQKMEAIGSLSGGIAHDFNNLLLVIRGYSGNLLEQLDDEALKENVKQIDNAAQRAAEFTRQLLAFSRQQVLRPEITDLNEVVAETLTLLRHTIEEVEVESILEEGVQPILIDRGQITQAILNLAINARDAMSDIGGTLSIRTTTAELDEGYAATHTGVEPGLYSVLQITDSGKGMDEETQARAFDPFFTTKEIGTGLGLATVYGLVKQSGGHIWLYSELGIGTTFKLYFPVAENKLLAEPRRSEPAGALGGLETILLVEDTDIVREFVATTLESYGYTVLSAAGGPEAIAIAEQQDGGIDLLMTDVVMPRMNGRELAERLSATRTSLRVLYTSGYPSDTILRNGIADARAVFIEKPYLPADLARKVREILDQRGASS
jgi:signal transduction histidine kinase